jgi:hypothetical protein
MTSEYQQIEAALNDYFDGLYHGDIQKLSQLFSPEASLFIEEQGGLTVIPVPEWLERVAKRTTPASQNASRADHIHLIDRTGPATAIAKVSCVIPPATYTDYLSLIKFNGRWNVVAKAYCQVASAV